MIVMAKFNDRALAPHTENRLYAYLVPDGDEPKVGDLIVTSFSQKPFSEMIPDNPGMCEDARIAHVVDLLPEHAKATKFYLMLIPRAEIVATQDRAITALRRKREREDAIKRLEEMASTDMRMVVWERLAEGNPEAERLLKIVKGE